MASGSGSTEPGLLEGTSGSWTRRLPNPPLAALATLSSRASVTKTFRLFP